jgi:hypothetical protein
MIVDDFDLESVAASPDEADPELVVDPDAMLATPVALECFETVAWQRQIVQPACGINLPELSQRDAFDLAKARYHFPIENQFRIAIAEPLNHRVA